MGRRPRGGRGLHAFVLQVIASLEEVGARHPHLLYAYDWLAFAHIVLAILFAGAMRDPVRNVWIVQCGLIMCALIPLLAWICIPLRGIPAAWFWIDSAFAPAAALPLWIALRDIRRAGAGAALTRPDWSTATAQVSVIPNYALAE